MHEYEDFLPAIIRNPDDYTPRLICADFLEEHRNEAERARAEFIRLQCKSGMEYDKESSRRSRHLLDKYEKVWLRPLGLTCKEAHFTGGFVTHARLTAARLLKLAPTLAKLAPLYALCLTSAQGRITEIANCELLDRIRLLDMPKNLIAAREAEVLASSPYLTALISLDLDCNGIFDHGALALAHSRSFKSLETLTLRSNCIGDLGAQAFARSSITYNLRILNLTGNRIGTPGVTALATACNLPKTRIFLDGAGIKLEEVTNLGGNSAKIYLYDSQGLVCQALNTIHSSG